MKGIYLPLVFFLLLKVNVSQAQEEFNEKDLWVLLGVNTNEAVYIPQVPSNNGIYIVQAGSKNVVAVDVKAKNHQFSYFQTGHENVVSSQIVSQTAYEEIKQFGNNNGSFHFVNSPDGNTSLHLNQIGTNLHFEMYGSNSIGDKLEFNMTGSSKAIIVRNFK